MSGDKVKAFKQNCHQILARAQEITDMKNKISDTAAKLGDVTEDNVKHIQKMVLNANASIVSEKLLIGELLNTIEDLIKARTERVIEFPTIDELRQQYNIFMSLVLPIIPSPYAPLCGAWGFPKGQVIQNTTFVCVPHDDLFILAYVLSFNPDEFTYDVCDADPELTEIVHFEVPADQVIPLPTSYPHRRAKCTTFQQGSRILALWQDPTTLVWTSVFYPATVRVPLTTAPGSYDLVFDGDDPAYAYVPERFCVSFPPGFE